ncbi:hypothetical protein GCM10011494_13350 [Novosphingobium endophyticum]|uniref:Lysozyme n=1 Tax=Novosphingobium endophyticum TaxID=1955250 RepID=A0A916TQR8_9SPHN|nr:lysozyme [Novosphingobium endophyticum]GGB96189.1 hypothetical protein GCM10011494_13350 [Novosphingobium endophyticum]
MNRKPIFDAVRGLLGRAFTRDEVARLDAAIDLALDQNVRAATRHSLGERGRALIRKWEGCARKRSDGLLEAYPDPGSKDGRPWTIGWGSTGPDIGPGTIWTQAQCDADFDETVARYAAEVADALGPAPTTQGQFDALVSFHYNTGAIRSATLTRLHRQGQFAMAAKEFAKWIHNDGRAMGGLRKRRDEEAALYLSG